MHLPDAGSTIQPSGSKPSNKRRLGIVWLLFAQLAAAFPAFGAASDPEPANIEKGRLIYEHGILPDGSPLQALRAEGVLFEGKSAACATCHRRSGMGSIEGSGVATILVPPVAGPLLFRTARFHGTFLDPAHHWVPNEAWARALTRSAYDETSLGRALREGVDADGKRLAPMPRYALDDHAVSALAAHLNQLVAKPAPGVGSDTLHVATVIAPDAPAGQADAVLGVMRAWAASARGIAKIWRLQVWKLVGPAESWGEQLQANYRRQPVFAVLSGAGGSQWSPVHRFCEENRLPCVLPSLEIAPESQGDYYSVYYSPGVTLEARVLASYLNNNPDAREAAPTIVQLFSDATGTKAAQTLRSHLEADTGEQIDHTYSHENPGAPLSNLPRDGVLMLWLRPEEIHQLVATAPQGPAVKHIFLSALLAPPEAVSLPPEWKAQVSWVSLFDDLGVQAQIAKVRLQRWLQQQGLPYKGTLRVQADAYAASYLFTTALSVISGEEVRRHPVPLNREHLIETLEILVDKYSDGTRWVNPDSHVAYYGRMSLAPGQRVAVRGGTLLRYASPESHKLVTASERIVP